MANTYEVEIKSLLVSPENAEKLKAILQKKYPDTKLVSKGNQLNHYFNSPADFSLLKKNTEPLVDASRRADLDHILTKGKKISIRTRDADGKVIFVIKASVGDDTSSNGVKRIEFESVVKMSLADLDALLIASGCSYQAKWSRARESYANKDITVCIDKNAGYGYLAHFRIDLVNRVDRRGLLGIVNDELISEEHVVACRLES